MGITGKVRFSITNSLNNKYTGILREGNSAGILRFSVEHEFNIENKSPSGAKNNLIPALSFKFFITNQPSANILTLNNRKGAETWNFFKPIQSTSFEIKSNDINGDQNLLERLRALARNSIWVNSVGLIKLASFNQNGSFFPDQKYPFRLDFIASDTVKNLFEDSYTQDFRVLISKINIGEKIYDVLAIEKPGCVGVKIGEIIADSNFTTSIFSDLHLFFKHDEITNDRFTIGDLESRSQFKEEQLIVGNEYTTAVCPFKRR